MDVEESFTAYVGARWAMLYRFAVLLAGESHAGDLTQTALLRAYGSWSRVQQAASPDAYVKRILVNAAVTEGQKRERMVVTLDDGLAEPHSSHEQAVVDRDVLWSRIGELPPRQRAVIVLRYYEDLSEAEIARVLDCARGTVKAHAAAALKTLRVSIADALDTETSGGRHD